MNKEHFHNQLTLRLGYNRIVNNNGIAIKVEYDNPNDPRIVIELPGGVTEGFNASEEPAMVCDRLLCSNMLIFNNSDLIKRDIEGIVEAAHYAYGNSIDDCLFTCQ